MNQRPAFISAPLGPELQRLIKSYRELAPWTWMLPDDLFGWRHPEKELIGYCTVQGGQGSYPGLMILKDCLPTYEELVEEEISPQEPMGMVKLAGVSLQFIPRKDAGPEALEAFDRLDIIWPFPDEIPFVQVLEPGWLPQAYLTEEGQELLTYGLYHSLAMAERIQVEVDLLENTAAGISSILLRWPQQSLSEPTWEDRWVSQQDLTNPDSLTNVDTLYVRSNAEGLPTQDEAWWADSFFVPQVTIEESTGKPYLPRVMLLLDGASGDWIDHKLGSPNDWPGMLQYLLVKNFLKQGYLPSAIWVIRQETYRYLYPICQALNIQLQMHPNREVLTGVKEALFGKF